MIPSAESRHPAYGPCDGFGPMWMCSQCTGLVGRDNGTYCDTFTGHDVPREVAQNRIGDFLMERIEMAAVAGWGCCDSPAEYEGFMRRALWMDLPGDPWRNEQFAVQGIAEPQEPPQ